MVFTDVTLYGILIGAAVGALVAWLLTVFSEHKRITLIEAAIAFGMTVVFSMVGTAVTEQWAKNDLLSFNENWNGIEVSADVRNDTCNRDGICHFEWDCDPYEVPYAVEVCSGVGDKRSCHSETRWRTEYHSCPYTTTEHVYTIQTTLGEYFVSRRFPDNPDKNRWRQSKKVPQGLISRYGEGIDPFWRDAKFRLDNGNPGPVTKRMSYVNYIYASQRTILNQYSDFITEYRKEGLLPDIQSKIRNLYWADRVYPVGNIKDVAAWSWLLSKLNGALGATRQGDLHIILTDNSKILKNIKRYIVAFKAHAQDPETFGRDVISKNSIMVVLGTEDGKTVSAAAALTGMPVGNSEIEVRVANDLIGLDFTPMAILGEVISKYSDGEVTYAPPQGGLAKIVLGVEGPGFIRVSMLGDDEDDVGTGFKYLQNEIRPTWEQKIWMLVMLAILSIIPYVVVAIIGDHHKYPKRGYRQQGGRL